MTRGTNTRRRRKRRRRTDVERLCATIASHSLQKATLTELQNEMGWDTLKLGRVIERGIADDACALEWVRGGRSVRFRGGENRGARGGIGLYSDVARVLERYWGPRRHCREIEVHASARPARRTGRTWVFPDLTMECHPGRKAGPDAAKLIYTFEIETAKGFTLQSIYQAHAHGRGATYSCVAYQHAAGCPGSEHPDWDRIVTTARELGIGLIGFANANAYRTWHVDREANRRNSTSSERAALYRTVLGRS